MYDKYEGLITIDGINIKELDKDSIRGNITIVSQNPYIFNMSIKDNLKLVKNNLTDKEMKEACKMACLDDFIESLPNKYDTIVGEGGINLSGGQKQRLAIARAFVQKTEISLFDEATSALDPQTTSSILKLLKKLNEQFGLTIVVITHEMNVVKELCNRVAVMNKGDLIEEGDIFEVFSNPKNRITQDFIDTTSNISKIYSLVEEGNNITKLNSGECIVRLKYKKESVAEALVSHISRKFNVDANIIFGNIELIDDSLLGGLVVIMHEKEKDGITKAIDFLKEQNVDIEVISDARITQ